MDAKQANIVYHDWEATTYDDKWSISFDERCIAYAAGRFRKAVREPRGFDRALEIGAGTGFFLLNLAQAGIAGELHVTDISSRMVQVCVANGSRLGLQVQGRVADAEALPYPDDTFDLVVGHAVVHHLPDLDTAFAELRRVLVPGGRLVIAGEPTRAGDAVANQFKRAARVGVKLVAAALGADRVLATHNGHDTECDRAAAALEEEVDQHLFTPRQLEDLGRRAGFCDVEVHTEELTASWFGWTTRTVEAMVGIERLPEGYPWFAYRLWQRLFAFDDAVAARVVPKSLFYNCILTATAPV
ncbi:MAG TPA: methyltransferase domain-containing protein [Egibacteraceae bacterium]|nr:methyltransferase domain-containing protein [Egibacteraceae bacterium]